MVQELIQVPYFDVITSATNPPAGVATVPRSAEDRCLLSFSPAVIYAAGPSPRGIVTADFNGDTRLDLAVSNSDSDTVSVLLGNGDGTFQAALTSGSGRGPKALLAGDLNRDGKTDLVTVGDLSTYPVVSELSVLLGNDDGTFQPPRTLVLPYMVPPGFPGAGPLYQIPMSVAVADLNADGNLDLVAGGWTRFVIVISDDPTDLMYEYHDNGYVNVLLGNGNGTFSAGTAYHVNGGQLPAGGLALRDFNGDGRTDVLNSWRVLLGNGDGTLQAPVPSNVYVAENANPVGDVNADGKLDIVYVGRITQVQLGNADGSFSLRIDSDLGTPASNSFRSAVLGDFDGDGLPTWPRSRPTTPTTTTTATTIPIRASSPWHATTASGRPRFRHLRPRRLSLSAT